MCSYYFYIKGGKSLPENILKEKNFKLVKGCMQSQSNLASSENHSREFSRSQPQDGEHDQHGLVFDSVVLVLDAPGSESQLYYQSSQQCDHDVVSGKYFLLGLIF